MEVDALNSAVSKEPNQRLFGFRRPVFPQRPAQAVPGCGEPDLVGIGILDDEPFKSFRMPSEDSEPDRTAVVLYKQPVVVEARQL